MPHEVRTIRRVVTLIALVLGLMPRIARADKIDSLVSQLSSSGDYKVRLSAALNLAKVSDPRAIPAFIAALGDSDKTVRGVAAAALGKQVTAETAAATRDKVLAALKNAASKDGNDFVRKQAQKAYDAVKAIAPEARPEIATGGGGTYINIGAMSVTGGDAKLKTLMRMTAQKTFKAKAATMKTEWPGGKDPSAKQLKGVTAFHVDGTLNEITVNGGDVSCKVSMLLATYPEKSMFGFLKGGAAVQGGSSATDIQYAKEDCVTAVMEDLIARKIIPTIQQRTK